MANHVLRHRDRGVVLAIVNLEGQAHEVWQNRRRAGLCPHWGRFIMGTLGPDDRESMIVQAAVRSWPSDSVRWFEGGHLTGRGEGLDGIVSSVTTRESESRLTFPHRALQKKPCWLHCVWRMSFEQSSLASQLLSRFLRRETLGTTIFPRGGTTGAPQTVSTSNSRPRWKHS